MSKTTIAVVAALAVGIAVGVIASSAVRRGNDSRGSTASGSVSGAGPV